MANNSQSDQFTTPEQEAASVKRYEDELVRRYESHLHLSATDRRDARRIIARRKRDEIEHAEAVYEESLIPPGGDA